jgi:hypothetical protein
LADDLELTDDQQAQIQVLYDDMLPEAINSTVPVKAGERTETSV